MLSIGQRGLVSGLVLCFLWGQSPLWGEEPFIVLPPRTDLTVQIRASVEGGSTAQALRYRYAVANAKESRQKLDLFAVYYQHPLTIKVISTPPDWMSHIFPGHVDTNEPPVVSWGAFSEVPPGASQDGFVMEAESLPGIVQVLYQGFIPLEELPIVPEEEEPETLPGASIFENSVKTKTIGPTPLPAEVNPQEFLTALIAQKEEAATLGWITNPGIKTSLDAKLTAAQRALERGQPQTARNQLTALLNEVEAQKEKHLTSEAYGLLKFNTEFLISKLPFVFTPTTSTTVTTSSTSTTFTTTTTTTTTRTSTTTTKPLPIVKTKNRLL